MGALTRRIALLEVDYEQTSSRLTTATEKLDEASKHAEEAERSFSLSLSLSLSLTHTHTAWRRGVVVSGVRQ